MPLTARLLVLVCFLPLGACDVGSFAATAAETDPEFPDLDGGDDWTDDDAGDQAAADGDDAAPDSGSEPEAGGDEDELDCLQIGWEGYQVDGTCPGLPATGAIAQDGCALEIPGELGLVIGAIGSIEGSLVTTPACSGIATTDAGPQVELTCLVDSATCTVELTGGLNSGFE